jgi:hypothetical protein
MHAPQVIYLQWYGDQPTTRIDDDDMEENIPLDELEEPPDSMDVTWSAEPIFDADVPYMRAIADIPRELQRAHARIRELELEQEWINDVGRPEHPDDERRWLPAYLDARRRVLQLADEIMTAQALIADGNAAEALELISMVQIPWNEQEMVNGLRGAPNLQEGESDQ